MGEVCEAEAGEVCEVKVAEVAGEVEIEPIRVDTKLHVVETEAKLGTKSRIHSLALCVMAGSCRQATLLCNMGAKSAKLS